MCRANVLPEAEEALADLMVDIATALSPDDPGSVVIGPVDFGCDTDCTEHRNWPESIDE